MKIDSDEINAICMNILCRNAGMPYTPSFCTWEGSGVIQDWMADRNWYSIVGFAPTGIWTVEFARPLNALKENERCCRAEAIATTERLDSVPVLIAIAALCTRKTLSLEGFVQKFSLEGDFSKPNAPVIQIR